MQVKEVTVFRQARVNTGNYEGLELQVSMTADLDPAFDTPELAAKELTGKVEAALLQQLQAVYKARGQNVSLPEICKRHGL